MHPGQTDTYGDKDAESYEVWRRWEPRILSGRSNVFEADHVW